MKSGGGGGGGGGGGERKGVEETRSGTERRCSHNLQSGHKAVIPGGGQRIIAVFFPQ